jgi:hypothetical protein
LSRPSEDLIPQVVTGKRADAIAISNLTLGIALDAPVQTSLGFHRFEPVIWNDVAIAPGNVTYPTRNFATLGPFNMLRATRHRTSREKLSVEFFLHVAMQIGLYHLQKSDLFEAWR